MEPNVLGELKDVIDEGADALVRKPLGKVFDEVDSLLGQKKEEEEESVDSE